MTTNRQQAILYAAVLGMEACWLYVLLALLNGVAVGGRLSAPGLLAVYPIAFGLNILIGRLCWPRAFRWSLSWLAWAAAVMVTVKFQIAGGLAWSDTAWMIAVPRSIIDVIYAFKPELLVLLATAVMWWMGRRMSRVVVRFGFLVAEFQFGLVILVAVFFIASELHADVAGPVPVALGFFLFGLVGISVAHALEGTSWLAGLYRGHWSGLLLASIAVVLVLGLLVSLLVTPDVLNAVVAAVKWMWGLFWRLVEMIMSFIAGLFPAPEPAEFTPMPAVPPAEPEQVSPFTMPDWLRSGLRLTWALAMLVFLLFALWRVSSNIFRWLRRRMAGTAGAEFESMRGAFRLDILNFFRRIWRRLLGLRLPFRPKQIEEAVAAETGPVRQVYRQFLRWAASAGCPRCAWQTPQEYCCTLAELMPEAAEDLDLVTQMYVRARYGARPSTAEQMDSLSRAWLRIRQNRPKSPATGE